MASGPKDVVLVLQGGAMRVAYTLGVLTSLQQSELQSRVKHIYSSSAGTVAALAYACSDIRVISSELLERLVSRRFISYRRITKIVDVDYLVDVVSELVDLSDNQKLCRVPITVSIVRAGDGLVEYRTLDGSNCQMLLRATMAIPVLYGRMVTVGDQRYVDGGLADSVPIVEAIRSHPSAIIGTVLNRSPHGMSDRATKKLDRAVVRVDPRMTSAVRGLMLGRSLLDQQAERWIEGKSLGHARIVSVEPSGSNATVSRTCTDLKVLEGLLQAGVSDGKRFCDELLSEIDI